MASTAQVLANRNNAAFSTGPATESGKLAASQNALAHGMTSKSRILPGEAESEYQALHDDIVSGLEPRGALELSLAEAVATTHWRLRRMDRIEAAFWSERTGAIMAAAEEAGAPVDADTAGASLFCDPVEQKKVALILRYLTTASRARVKALNEFRDSRKAREASPEPSDSLAIQQQFLASDFDSDRPHPASIEAISHAEPATEGVDEPDNQQPGISQDVVPAQAPSHTNRSQRRARDRELRNAEERAARQAALPQNGFVSQSAAS